MILSLNAESKHKVGYTPDWLKVSYVENGQELELTLDIQGNIEYSDECLICRCKGELIPWVLWNYTTGNETNLSELSREDVEKLFSIEKITDILRMGKDFEVGIYPAKDDKTAFKLAKNDVLSNCTGSCEIRIGNHTHLIYFVFKTEFNGY